MEEQVGKDLLEVLKSLQAELHGKLDKRKVRRLCKVVTKEIAKLETALKDEKKGSLTPAYLLVVIASVAGAVDKIAKAISNLKK